MSIVKKLTEKDLKARISTLWIIVLINILAADVFTFVLPGSEDKIQVTQVMMLAFAVIQEIPIAMIYLSRILKERVNRRANIIASAITIVYIIAGCSVTLHYLFFAVMEILAMLLIIKYSRKLTEGAAQPVDR